MLIAQRITFYGLCREAIKLYCDVLGFMVENITTYGENNVLGIPLDPEQKDLIQNAELTHPSGMRLIFGDSMTLLLSTETVKSGNRDNIIIEVYGLTKNEIISIYEKLMGNQSVSQFQLGPKDGYELFASVMDRFTVCWNLSCG